MTNKLRFILLLILSISYFPSHAMNGIFWQPQNRDLSITDASWKSLMQEVHKQGFDTLVVQWTRHGPSFSSSDDRKKLRQKIYDAHEAGLKLVIGLYSDPEFFTRQKQPNEALNNYLNRLRVFDIQQVKLWKKELGIDPQGWYISAEIDDVNWRDESIRSNMLNWLKSTKNNIEKYSTQPVYISSFFSGNMSPESYHQLIEEIRGQGINIWIQDGGGVGKLTAAQRALYLDSTQKCINTNNVNASGIIYEVFNIALDENFRASPKSKKEIDTLLTQHTACQQDSIYFSLRYLPLSTGVLDYTNYETEKK